MNEVRYISYIATSVVVVHFSLPDINFYFLLNPQLFWLRGNLDFQIWQAIAKASIRSRLDRVFSSSSSSFAPTTPCHPKFPPRRQVTEVVDLTSPLRHKPAYFSPEKLNPAQSPLLSPRTEISEAMQSSSSSPSSSTFIHSSSSSSTSSPSIASSQTSSSLSTPAMRGQSSPVKILSTPARILSTPVRPQSVPIFSTPVPIFSNQSSPVPIFSTPIQILSSPLVKSPLDAPKKKVTPHKIFEYGLIVWVNSCYLTNRLIGVVRDQVLWPESPSTRSRPTSLSRPQRLDHLVYPPRANREP